MKRLVEGIDSLSSSFSDEFWGHTVNKTQAFYSHTHTHNLDWYILETNQLHKNPFSTFISYEEGVCLIENFD